MTEYTAMQDYVRGCILFPAGARRAPETGLCKFCCALRARISAPLQTCVFSD